MSPVDPDSGLFYKNQRERMFCYSFNTACDQNGFVLGNTVSAGNVHDSKNFASVFNQVKEKFGAIKAVCADAGYLTPHIAKLIIDSDLRPVLPYKSPSTKKGFFRKHEYVYDEYYDTYICPAGNLLSYATTDRDGRSLYKSNPEDCRDCPHLHKCTHSKNHQKIVSRHVWAEHLETCNHLRHSSENKRIYPKRQQTIERVFADLKEKHSMRYTNYRGLSRVEDEALLVFACMNLKKMATWKANRAS